MTAAELDVYWDARVLDHDTGRGVFEAAPSPLVAIPELHPENAERVANMRALLADGPLAPRLAWHPGRLATAAELEAVHPASYIEAIRRACLDGPTRLTGTTVVGPTSWEPLLAAAGTCLEAADAVLAGRAARAYALVRPPGHHAQPAQADGYCAFSHAALVAERARAAGAERVAVIDWDVHHGNGTQECFYERDDVLAVSLHMRHGAWGPSHPQTGAPTELGRGAGSGRTVNVELDLGAGDAAYAEAFARVVEPVVTAFAPDVLVCASGQDASAFDPNGRMAVTMAGFRAIGERVRALADACTGGRAILVQEGGYARTYAAFCLHATLEGLLGTGPLLADPLAYVPDDARSPRADVDACVAALAPHWAPILPAWRCAPSSSPSPPASS